MRSISAAAWAAALVVGLGSVAMAQSPTSPGATGHSIGTGTTSGGAGNVGTPPSAASGGSLSGSEGMSSTSGQVATQSQVKAKLEANGYTDIQSVHKSTSGWTASAAKNGKHMRVAVDNQDNITVQ